MHWIYLIHEFHNLSWITEINELFHHILIYWDATVFLNKYNKKCSCDLMWSIITKSVMKKNWTCSAAPLELTLASSFIRKCMRLIVHFYSELTSNSRHIYIYTLTGHFIRYTLQVLGWAFFCLQNRLNSLWHRFNKGLETFLRDFGPYWHDSIMQFLFFKYSDQPVWHQQPFHVQSHSNPLSQVLFI